jgi:tetratricopeptide (TPR) repeat protein
LINADGGEPSFASYARIYREERFVETWRRLILLRDTLGVPTEDFLNEALPEFETHPYAPFLLLYAGSPAVRQAVLPKAIAALNARFAEFSISTYIDVYQEIGRHDEDSRKDLLTLTVRGNDDVYRDRKTRMQWFKPRDGVDPGAILRKISPHAPSGCVDLISRSKDDPAGRADAKKWEKEFASQPVVLAKLGQQYASWKDLENAQRLYTAAIKLSADASTFFELADTYKAVGDLDGWKKTLDEYLAQEPDGGLGQAQARAKIAYYFMNRGEWDKAQPYAEESAQSYAHFAMQCAIDCYEGMEDWEHAETWVIRQAERYNLVKTWYYWCLRTGHGHLKNARDVLNNSIPQGRLTLGDMGEFTEFDGSKREAFDFFQRQYAASGDVGQGVPFIALADDVDEIQARDQALKLMAAKVDPPGADPSYEGQLAIFAKLLQDVLARGEKGMFDEAAFEELVNTSRPEQQPIFLYYAGRFAEKHGHPEKALPLYERTLTYKIPDLYLLTSATLDARRLSKSSPPKPTPAKSKSSKNSKKKSPSKTKRSSRGSAPARIGSPK